jgi:hypothetical protein
VVSGTPAGKAVSLIDAFCRIFEIGAGRVRIGFHVQSANLRAWKCQ